MRQTILSVSKLAVILLVILGIAGCELFEESPIRNPSSPVDAELASNFWATPSTGDRFGVALGIDALRVRSLPGDYLLTYTTQLGIFYIPFRALETVKLTIALQPNDTVIGATLQPGTITDISSGTALDDGTVIAILGPGGGPIVNWQDVFSLNMNRPIVVLVQGGQAVESENVEDLTGGLTVTYGVHIKGGLQLYVPKGDYLVEYTTTHGTFHVVFRALWQRFVTIRLQKDDTVRYVSIRQGVIPYGFEPIEQEGAVEFYFLPGSSPTLVWSDVFIVNWNLPLIILVEEGEIVTTNPFVIVIVLPEINELPGGFDPGIPGEFGPGCENLSIPFGALPPPGECKVWDPYLPAGQQGPPGACSCANVVPGTCLVDHYGNATACN